MVREVLANRDSYKAIINILPVPTFSTIKGQFNLDITSPQAVEDRTFCIANAPTTCASMCANVVTKPFFVALETSMRNQKIILKGNTSFQKFRSVPKPAYYCAMHSVHVCD